MPLIRIETVAPDVRLGLWQIEESLTVFCNASKRLRRLNSQLLAYRSTARRLEVLATYSLLFAMTGHEELSITHDSNGKPHVEGFHVSISHTRGYAALILSTSREVAVDIEYYSNRVKRIAHKFIREDEDAETLDSQLINWSAKETVYKLLSAESLQFFEMRLHPFTPQEQGRIKVQDLKNDHTISVYYRLDPAFVLTYAISSSSSLTHNGIVTGHGNECDEE